MPFYYHAKYAKAFDDSVVGILSNVCVEFGGYVNKNGGWFEISDESLRDYAGLTGSEFVHAITELTNKFHLDEDGGSYPLLIHVPNPVGDTKWWVNLKAFDEILRNA